MKFRISLLLLSFALAMSSTLMAHAGACSNSTIQGTYAFTIHGQVFLQDGSTLLIDGLAKTTFDGNGNLTQLDAIAVNGNAPAVVRESADLLYNLTVLWAAAGVKPEDVWREMERREDMLGIAEKLPKSAAKLPMELHKAAAPPAARRRIVALEPRALRKRQ